MIADDISALKPALKRIYPTVPIQLCHNHYFEILRQMLRIRTEDKYHDFFYELKGAFNPKNHYSKRQAWLTGIYYRYGKHDKMVQTILVDVQQRYDNFFAFNSQYREQCPNTTNIIESFNSHLQGRLKSIKGFQSFHSAERWLNAWMIRRRTKPFTDCEEPFKHLNGKSSLEVALKKDVKFPEILGIKRIN